MNHFQMDPTDVLSFFRLLERGYHSGNPYHNALHASDVTQVLMLLCKQVQKNDYDDNIIQSKTRVVYFPWLYIFLYGSPPPYLVFEVCDLEF